MTFNFISSVPIIQPVFMVILFLGYFSSLLIKRYGTRTVMFLGACFYSLGLFCSFFAPNILVLFVTYGLLCGNYLKQHCLRSLLLVFLSLEHSILVIINIHSYPCLLLIFRCWSWYDICTFNNDRKPVLRSQALACQWNTDLWLRHRSTGDVTNHREISGGLWMARISADLFLFYITIVCLCLSNETCQNVQQSGAEK